MQAWLTIPSTCRTPPTHTSPSLTWYHRALFYCPDQHLTKMPLQPFPFDYTQTLLSLLDILSALYAKLAKLLGPSPFPHASQHMLGLAPHPGVSYLFQNQTPASATDDALMNVALGSGIGASVGNALGNGVLHSPPPSWTPAMGELVLKVDGKFKVSPLYGVDIGPKLKKKTPFSFFLWGVGGFFFGIENHFGAPEGPRCFRAK